MSDRGKPPPLPPLSDAERHRLHEEAVARLSARAAGSDAAPPATAEPDEVQRVVHELQVHQIELEMQNEELRRAHAELDLGRARWFELYDLAPVGYCTVSAAGIITQANLTIANLVGHSRSTLVARPFSHLVAAPDQSAYYLARRQIARDGLPQSLELQMIGLHERTWWAQLTMTAAVDGEGAPELRLVVSDVSARKNAETAAATLQSQLQQAQKMESVGRLAGGVAHDYNNMLAVILGYTELALLHADTVALRDDLTEVHRAATRSAALTQQLLTFARKQHLQPQVLDLNAVTAHSLLMLRRLIGEQIQFDWRPGADLWPVTVDATQVDQILTNLCLNARDAIRGAGTIRIATANCELTDSQAAALNDTHGDARPGQYARLTVTDDGCGMDEATLQRIFEPFFTTKDVGEGTGLGLASVYGAVRQSDGFITASSVPGHGTTFAVYLPRNDTPVAFASSPGPSVPSARGHETILVVEDELAVRLMTARALQRQGYTVHTAAGPSEALALAHQLDTVLDLLLTDVQMPEMSGPALALKLRARFPTLKIVLMSGYANHSIDSDAYAGGNLPFLAKPFSLAALTDKVREVLDN
jgi:two-component system cell cycle sensor histidine kinase/response regulator CckA